MKRHSEDRRSRRFGRLGEEAGAGAIRTVVTLAFVVSVVYAGFKFIPVKAASFQFEDAIREQVVLAGVRRRRVTEQQVQNLLVERAAELGLAVEGRDVSVVIARSKVHIRAAYVVPVQLVFGYVYHWAFIVDEQGPSF